MRSVNTLLGLLARNGWSGGSFGRKSIGKWRAAQTVCSRAAFFRGYGSIRDLRGVLASLRRALDQPGAGRFRSKVTTEISRNIFQGFMRGILHNQLGTSGQHRSRTTRAKEYWTHTF